MVRVTIQRPKTKNYKERTLEDEHTYAKTRSFHDNISKKRYKELIATKDKIYQSYSGHTRNLED